jgi:SAM-dependent methyltransferase
MGDGISGRKSSDAMSVLENRRSRGLVYRSLRAGFRILPESLRKFLWDLRFSLADKDTLKLKTEGYLGKCRCSVCGYRVQRFLPIEPAHQETLRTYGWKFTAAEAETCNTASYLCPHCGATDRERLYALYLADYLRAITPNGHVRLIEFAPFVPLSEFIRKLVVRMPHNISYVTADLSMEGVDDKVDIMDMKIYADNSVDFFICSHVLEHVQDDRKALSELFRILKNGGRGILMVPIVLSISEIDEDPSVTDEAERWRRFGQFDHVRLYSKQGFLARTQEAGFMTHQLGQDYFGPDTFAKYGITAQSVLYVVEKK